MKTVHTFSIALVEVDLNTDAQHETLHHTQIDLCRLYAKQQLEMLIDNELPAEQVERLPAIAATMIAEGQMVHAYDAELWSNTLSMVLEIVNFVSARLDDDEIETDELAKHLTVLGLDQALIASAVAGFEAFAATEPKETT